MPVRVSPRRGYDGFGGHMASVSTDGREDRTERSLDYAVRQAHGRGPNRKPMVTAGRSKPRCIHGHRCSIDYRWDNQCRGTGRPRRSVAKWQDGSLRCAFVGMRRVSRRRDTGAWG